MDHATHSVPCTVKYARPTEDLLEFMRLARPSRQPPRLQCSSLHSRSYSFLGRLIVFGYTWALLHHLFSGLRHFVWDLGYGFKASEREALTWGALIAGIVATVLLWVVAEFTDGLNPIHAMIHDLLKRKVARESICRMAFRTPRRNDQAPPRHSLRDNMLRSSLARCCMRPPSDCA
jgi:hypothetical protein